jgi:hypothetical protein
VLWITARHGQKFRISVSTRIRFPIDGLHKWPACFSMLMFYFRQHTGPVRDFLSYGNLAKLSCVALAMRLKKRELIWVLKFNEPG